MKKRIITALLSVSVLAAGFSAKGADQVYADEGEEVYRVTFFDYDGKPFTVLEVKEGEKIDYSLVEKENYSKLNYHNDKYTQVRFSSWSKTPETVKENTNIMALSETGVIKLVSLPAQTEYLVKTGPINLDGLKVSITVTTQKVNNLGGVYTEKSFIENIAASCTTIPKSLSEAFSKEDTSLISIYPPNSVLPIAEYEITYLSDLGDVCLDGAVDSVDASYVLSHYASVSTSGKGILDETQCANADVNRDGNIDAVDASYILMYYSLQATGKKPDWQNIIN